MTAKRKVEVFRLSAGCPASNEVVEMVQRVAGPSCEVTVLDMTDSSVAERAKTLGIRTSVPSVVIDGKLARGVDEQVLRAAGLGAPAPQRPSRRSLLVGVLRDSTS